MDHGDNRQPCNIELTQTQETPASQFINSNRASIEAEMRKRFVARYTNPLGIHDELVNQRVQREWVKEEAFLNLVIDAFERWKIDTHGPRFA